MFAQVHYPETLLKKELDEYLDRGWFRMGQSIFTTNFLHFRQQFYSAIWLRVDLAIWNEDLSERKLFQKNRQFTWEVKPLDVSEAKEELFSKYRSQVSFEPSPTLEHLLFGRQPDHDVFDTREVNLYDGNRLIASGFFDVGETAAEGITSFYDPEYKRYSLGRYLIYLKMAHCRQMGLQYFYPGYFVPGYSYFDYKLKIGSNALEYLDVVTGSWFSIDQFQYSPYSEMYDRLASLSGMLSAAHVANQLYKYEFFDANLFPELRDVMLLDFPLFIRCFPPQPDTVNPMVVYDVRDKLFHLIQCRSLWDSNLPPADPSIYSMHLLQPEYELFTSTTAEEMVARMLLDIKV